MDYRLFTTTVVRQTVNGTKAETTLKIDAEVGVRVCRTRDHLVGLSDSAPQTAS